MNATRNEPGADSVSGPRLITIAGAKGGTGKSVIAANVGVFLATLGKRVVLVDAAFGAATLHSFVGASEATQTLAGFLAREDAQLEEILVSTPISNLQLVSGERDPGWAANPRIEQLEKFRERIRELDVDYVVLDLGPGTRDSVLDLFLDADMSILTCNAEPTAVELTYRFVKAAFVHSLRRAGHGALTKMTVDEAREFEGGIAAPLDLLQRGLARHPPDSEEVATLRSHMKNLTPYLVLNFARSKGDMDLGKDIATAATKRFGIVVPYLGHVEYDDAVWVSLRRRRPLLVEHPESRASKCIEKITRRILGLEADSACKMTLPGDSLYDLLEVAPTASEEHIRRANRRIRQVYAKDSAVVGGLYTAAGLGVLHRRLEEAYVTLMNPAKRRANDLALFPDGIPNEPIVDMPSAQVGVAPVVGERPGAPKVDENTEYTGELLMLFRESRGLEIREIADRSKIGIVYLDAIEKEAFEELPAVVYVRGFLLEYAKMLELDVTQVVETYLARVRLWREENIAE
ncbi:MAG: P-loop NTPase [Myxococcales bacterium]|nr:P-loop NTPase [Myxococcales bacterium]